MTASSTALRAGHYVEPADASTALIAALCAILRARGTNLRMAALDGIAPLPHGCISPHLLDFVARRVGVRLLPMSELLLDGTEFAGPLLVEVPPIWGMATAVSAGVVEVYLPALGGPRALPLARTRRVFRVELAQRPGPSVLRRRTMRPGVYCYVRPCHVPRFSAADVAAAAEALPPVKVSPPAPLIDWSIGSLFASHGAMMPSLPEFYGCFRKVVIARHPTVFADPRDLAPCVEALLGEAAAGILDSEAALKCARIYSDFVTLHPFVDGNGRMARVIVDKMAADAGLDLAWSEISRAQLYYGARLANRGHIRALTQLFHAALGMLQEQRGPNL
jgi:hypothetical protein